MPTTIITGRDLSLTIDGDDYDPQASSVTLSTEITREKYEVLDGPVYKTLETNSTLSVEMLADWGESGSLCEALIVQPRTFGFDLSPNAQSLAFDGFDDRAGSRVLVLVDDLPILSGDVGDIKWDYLPVENIAQIEIIKGASSVLYGSSALNGVFHIRTGYPAAEPGTSISSYVGFYSDPRREEMVWWDKRPVWTGLQFLHSRKAGNLDLVVGGQLFLDQGYRKDENQERIRQKELSGLWKVAWVVSPDQSS